MTSSSLVEARERATTPSVKTSRCPGIFLALNPLEHSLFFPSLVREDFPPQRFLNTEAPAAVWRETLEDACPEILVTSWSTPPLPLDWITRLDNPLRYVCHVTGTVRHIVPRQFLERGGRLTNWGGLAAREVAEHALLLALGALRRMPRWPGLEVKAGGPSSTVLLRTRTLFGCRVGLHGFGGVARTLRNLLRAFGVTVRVFAPGVPLAVFQHHEVEPCSSLTDLFADSDVLFECEALTPLSRRSVSAPVLAALPDGALFVNIARGQIVDEEALLAEARQGRIHLALDVLNAEPPPMDSPFSRLPNVLYSPHLAGPTFDSLPACGEFALRNVDHYLRGEPLESEIDLEIYDRST